MKGMTTLRFILFILWTGMFCMTLFLIYSLYVNLNRSDGVVPIQIAMNFVFALFFLLICFRSFTTLYSEKVTEKLAADPKMSGFKIVLLILGIPAIIFPGIFLITSIPIQPKIHSVGMERFGDVNGNDLIWHPDAGLVFAFFAGIVLVAFAILYPKYVKGLIQ